MSAISSMGSSPQMQLIDQLRQRNDPGGEGLAAQFQSRFADAAKAAGVDAAKIPDLQKQVQEAVQSALQGTGGDRRTAVSNAVDSVLKQNGVDPVAFKSAMKAQQGSGGGKVHHRHGGHKATGAPSKVKDPSDPNAEDDPNSVATTLQNQLTGVGKLFDVAA